MVQVKEFATGDSQSVSLYTPDDTTLEYIFLIASDILNNPAQHIENYIKLKKMIGFDKDVEKVTHILIIFDKRNKPILSLSKCYNFYGYDCETLLEPIANIFGVEKNEYTTA